MNRGGRYALIAETIEGQRIVFVVLTEGLTRARVFSGAALDEGAAEGAVARVNGIVTRAQIDEEALNDEFSTSKVFSPSPRATSKAPAVVA